MRNQDTADSLAGLAALSEEVRPALCRLCHRQGIPPWDAEDLVQKALVAALRRWSTIGDQRRWLCGTVRRMCIVYWQRRREERLVPTDPTWLDLRPGGVVGPQHRRDLLVDLDTLCAGLPRRQQLVMYLRHRLGLHLAETAVELATSVSTVFREERRGVARLKAQLARPAAGTVAVTCRRPRRTPAADRA
jgi:RNA polymerase sigma factor (sigma-70 family)